MISPQAFDFTMKVSDGWITPSATAATTISRRSTGTVSYRGADSACLQAAPPSASAAATARRGYRDRKSTRLNSSHSQISYAVFCLKKKKKKTNHPPKQQKKTQKPRADLH